MNAVLLVIAVAVPGLGWLPRGTAIVALTAMPLIVIGAVAAALAASGYAGLRRRISADCESRFSEMDSRCRRDWVYVSYNPSPRSLETTERVNREHVAG